MGGPTVIEVLEESAGWLGAADLEPERIVGNLLDSDALAVDLHLAEPFVPTGAAGPLGVCEWWRHIVQGGGNIVIRSVALDFDGGDRVRSLGLLAPAVAGTSAQAGGLTRRCGGPGGRQADPVRNVAAASRDAGVPRGRGTARTPTCRRPRVGGPGWCMCRRCWSRT